MGAHQMRHNKPKRKKPKRTVPMGLTDEQLPEHRELAMLRIAGGAKPGPHRDKLMAERIEKLNACTRPHQIEALFDMESALNALAEKFNSKR